LATVFISHRKVDDAEALRLAEDLKKVGHDVWLDEWTIDIGDSLIERMQEGLQDSAYLVLCYSGAGVLSPWISREWMSALARQLNGCNVKILPVMLTGDEIPAILADIYTADLRLDWNKGLTLLIRSIK
jgi:hypothetical protein